MSRHSKTVDECSGVCSERLRALIHGRKRLLLAPDLQRDGVALLGDVTSRIESPVHSASCIDMSGPIERLRAR